MGFAVRPCQCSLYVAATDPAAIAHLPIKINMIKGMTSIQNENTYCHRIPSLRANIRPRHVQYHVQWHIHTKVLMGMPEASRKRYQSRSWTTKGLADFSAT